MQAIIDRFEGDQAVVELPDMVTVSVLHNLFPAVKEGNIYKIIKDEKESAKHVKNKSYIHVVIKRIENNNAIIELPDMSTIASPLMLFPGAKEGDVYQISKDEEERSIREKRIRDKFNKLMNT